MPEMRFMEVCGTHTMAIAKAGIRNLLPDWVRLISGPGCPVCVTPVDFIDEAVYLGENVVVMTPRPGRIKHIYKTDLGTPRLRTGSLFAKAREDIYKEFFKEAEIPFTYNI